MRVLLDENLPRKLKNAITTEAQTVPECGWSGVKNGHYTAIEEAVPGRIVRLAV